MVPTSIAAATRDEEEGHGHERHRRQLEDFKDESATKQPSQRRQDGARANEVQQA